MSQVLLTFNEQNRALLPSSVVLVGWTVTMAENMLEKQCRNLMNYLLGDFSVFKGLG